jgi:hypothetical protein
MSLLTENAEEIVNDPEIQIVVELVGGIHPAFDLIKTALKMETHCNRKQRAFSKKRRRIIQCCGRK